MLSCLGFIYHCKNPEQLTLYGAKERFGCKPIPAVVTEAEMDARGGAAESEPKLTSFVTPDIWSATSSGIKGRWSYVESDTEVILQYRPRLKSETILKRYM